MDTGTRRFPHLWGFRSLLLLAAAGLTAGQPAALRAADKAAFVVQISVDGLGSGYIQAMIDQHRAPNFERLQREGAWTHNARTDFDFTVTLPNHTCMITGRPVMDKSTAAGPILGHWWRENVEPGPATLHSNRRAYVKSAFDVAHDNGLSTALYASKTKFVLYNQSFDASGGAPDTIGADNGRNKIDKYLYDGDSAVILRSFLSAMADKPVNYTFMHFHDPDTAGHAFGWGSFAYEKAIEHVDGHMGDILKLATSNERLKDKTVLIVSADHGGRDRNHGENTDPLNYTIPFYVWGAGVAKGKDLYEVNQASRRDPAADRPDYTASGPPPIRNGDGGNLALGLLGLKAIPDSSINAAQDLKVGE